jgi:hypothetical protein
MSSLTGSQINQSYQGLIKLADSTTGVTTSLQTLQDGLGNDLPMGVKDGYFYTPNQYTFPLYKGKYYGPGFSTSASAGVAGTQNTVFVYPFMDQGLYSYSAITYNLSQVTSTSDVVTVAFYDTEIYEDGGLYPGNLIMSGITLASTGSTGLRTTSLPSTLSFSGTGAGLYFMCAIISNTNVTPTVRYTSTSQIVNIIGLNNYGNYANTANTAIAGQQGNAAGTIIRQRLSIGSFPTTFTQSDITGRQATTPQDIGFVLNTIR